MSVDEYVALDRASEERWEYANGEAFAMAGASPRARHRGRERRGRAAGGSARERVPRALRRAEGRDAPHACVSPPRLRRRLRHAPLRRARDREPELAGRGALSVHRRLRPRGQARPLSDDRVVHRIPARLPRGPRHRAPPADRNGASGSSRSTARGRWSSSCSESGSSSPTSSRTSSASGAERQGSSQGGAASELPPAPTPQG